MTMTPCSDPANDPDDWFIGRDGRQYSEDQLTEEEFEVAKAKRIAARAACYRCPVRLKCLDVALQTKPMYGTWGGYYPDQLKTLYSKIKERKAAHGTQEQERGATEPSPPVGDGSATGTQG